MNNLFDNESDSDNGEKSFKTNKDYAKTFNQQKQKEMLQKCKFNFDRFSSLCCDP